MWIALLSPQFQSNIIVSSSALVVAYCGLILESMNIFVSVFFVYMMYWDYTVIAADQQ